MVPRTAAKLRPTENGFQLDIINGQTSMVLPSVPGEPRLEGVRADPVCLCSADRAVLQKCRMVLLG